MSTARHRTPGRHRSGHSKVPYGIAAWLISVLAGMVLVPVAIGEALRYRSTPAQPRNPGLPLGLAASLLIAVPVLLLAVWVITRALREYRAWKRSLTPAQRLAVSLAENAALWGAHVVLHDRNRAESARLAASVMGERTVTDPSGGANG